MELSGESLINSKYKSSIVTYDGLLKEGKPHGKGYIIYTDRSTYRGDFKDGKICGYGVITFPNSNRYEGYLKDDQRHGFGVFEWADGERYEGSFVNDVREGQGTYYYSNGAIYTGEFLSGLKHGKGIFYYHKSKKNQLKGTKCDKYIGEFKNGVRSGYGILQFANGNLYEGNFSQDKREGKGVFIWASGNRYEGDFHADKRNGSGTYFWTSGGKYTGDFEIDKRSGTGVYQYPDGSIYEGCFKDGMFEGIGSYYNKNGWKFEGEFVSYKRDGVGLSVSPGCERKFKEEWYDGRLTNREELPEEDTASVIQERWKLTKKIGSGSYGEIYAAVDKKTMEHFAIKLEKRERKKLAMEIDLLTTLADCKYVSKYYTCGHNCNYSFMVMELLGQNLNELRKNQAKGRLSLASTASLGMQMLRAVEALHKCGFVHRDIKPSNFTMGNPPNQKNCYIIDFGLAKRFKTNGQLVPPRKKAGWNGTQRYASINTHKRLELGPHDDLWSLFYVLVQFAKGSLPWCDTRGKEEIGKVKIAYNNPKLVQHLPVEFLKFMTHLQDLTYFDTPDYEFLYSQLELVYRRELKSKKRTGHVYEWLVPSKKTKT